MVSRILTAASPSDGSPARSPVVALFAIDPDGSDEVQLTEGESAFPSWSPDGTRLAYTARIEDGSWQVATMAADGSDIRMLTSGAGVHEVPTWSPDGTWLAYDYSPTMPSDPAFRTQLWRMDADGGKQELLGSADTFDIEPRISPDGRSILFQRLTNGGETSTLTVRDIATGQETSFPAAGTLAHHPTWSPDGQWITYNTGRTNERRDQVEQVAADGSGEPVVVFKGTTALAGFKPVYSPDGSRILFGCWGVQGATTDAACLMHRDGSDVQVLVDEPDADENHFSWGRSPL
jgi:Tol biopolymer transport system component